MKSEYEQTELIIALLKRIADKMDPDTSVSFAEPKRLVEDNRYLRNQSEEDAFVTLKNGEEVLTGADVDKRYHTGGVVRRNFHGSPFDEGDWQIHNDGKVGEDE